MKIKSKQNNKKIVKIKKKLIPLDAFNRVGKAKSRLVENLTEKQRDVIKKNEIVKIVVLKKNKLLVESNRAIKKYNTAKNNV